MPARDPHDEAPPPARAHALTHPDRLATQATLLGLTPADPAACRVLEIGCGDGGNIAPMALDLPGSEFVGVDASDAAIERAAQLAVDVRATNVRFVAADLRELPDALGSFDFVIAHGIYSWVPPRTRTALLASVRRLLAPGGVAFVSYNAYPGSYLRDMAGDVLRFHMDASRATDPTDRLARAQELMRVLALVPVDTPQARAMSSEMQRMLARPGWQLLRDELADVNTPVYFHEFAGHAAEHELTFLAEAHLADSRLAGLPPEAVAALEALPPDVVLREQYLDFLRNRSFRQTLLCHAREAPVTWDIDIARLDRLWIAAPAQRLPGVAGIGDAEGARFRLAAATVATPDGDLAAAFDQLGDAWPGSVRLDDMAGSDDRATRARLATALLGAHAGRAVELHVRPPAAAIAGERPVAGAMARWQAQRGEATVTNLRHEPVRLDDDVTRDLLGLLDGSRTRTDLLELVRAMPAAAGVADLAQALETALGDLGAASLLAREGLDSGYVQAFPT